MTILQEDEINRLKKELEDLRLTNSLKPFTDELCAHLGLAMATTHPNDWTSKEQIAFAHTARQFPVLAQLWKQRIESIYGAKTHG